MKTALLRRARKHFKVDMVPTHTQRYNMRSWVRALRQLGDNWILRQPIARVQS